jgi:hypothetical protein
VKACRLAKIGDDLLDLAEWNEVSKLFLARVEHNTLAAVFRNVGAEKFLGLKSRRKKVDVIHQGVSNVCGGKRGRKLGLPNALGEPGAGRTTAEMIFEIGSEAGDLFALIFRRDRNENRFIKSTAYEFHLPALDQLFQAGKILGTVFFDPMKKGTGIVKTEMNAGMFFQLFDEGEIASEVGFLEDMLEIAARLMGMDQESEMETLGHGDSFFSP